MSDRNISLSIVSHGQAELVRILLTDLEQYCSQEIEVIVTLNIREEHSFARSGYSFPLILIENHQPQGFAANQNQAFHKCSGRYFCTANPDIRLKGNPFPILINSLRESAVGVVGPAILNAEGHIEPSARKFPTLSSILQKAIAWKPLHDYSGAVQMGEPDWIAGTFMLFKAETFARLGGFDERYFLYYEDVDICARIRSAGLRVVLASAARIVHDASRRSWRDPSFTLMHLRSMLRYFFNKRRLTASTRSQASPR